MRDEGPLTRRSRLRMLVTFACILVNTISLSACGSDLPKTEEELFSGKHGELLVRRERHDGCFHFADSNDNFRLDAKDGVFVDHDCDGSIDDRISHAVFEEEHPHNEFVDRAWSRSVFSSDLIVALDVGKDVSSQDSEQANERLTAKTLAASLEAAIEKGAAEQGTALPYVLLSRASDTPRTQIFFFYKGETLSKSGTGDALDSVPKVIDTVLARDGENGDPIKLD